jgi:hypothetical protein
MQALTGLTRHYEASVRHTPRESWLIVKSTVDDMPAGQTSGSP